MTITRHAVMRTAALAVMVASLLFAPAGAAAAASAEEAARAASERGYFVEDPSVADPGTLASLASEMGRRGYRFIPIALSSVPASGATVVADSVLDRLGTGTVVVFAPGELGYSSTELDRSRLDSAADASAAEFRVDGTRGFVSFAQVIVRGGSGSVTRPGSRGISLFPIILILGMFLLFLRPFFRARRGFQVDDERAIADAKAEISRQTSVVADGILDLGDRVSATDDAEAKQHFHDASETYARLETDLTGARTLAHLEAIADRLDHARWQIEATRARLEGRPVPKEPRDEPASCFFDPAHGAGVERVEVEGPEGVATVRICEYCADTLRQGEVPESRSVLVGGRRVPAGAAPRSYGGFGLGFLPLSFLLPGASAVFFDWGRSGGGFFGGGMLGGGLFGGGILRGGGGFGGGLGSGGRARGGMRFGRGRGGRSI